jgi:Zn-dependent protease with chaperone function
MNNYYPASPLPVPLSVTAPSITFKKEVQKVLVSIVLFFVVYLMLITLSVLLAAACVYAGFYVMVNSGHFIGIVAGIGIMSIGVMVFIFLIKFIFSVKKFDEAGSVEVTEKEQPLLFDFIKRLTIDTQTAFPKKIILSPEVNACVFYNDSFWSMIFPVRKNLQIGLGLVNSLTLSEFKAVMAHEFGHFSQRSMKLGSFVYNVNKAIYNMLFENKDFAGFLQGLGSLHAIIGLFVSITIQIIIGIQKILQWMYGFINKNYMGLSREMEFHADAVAASVSGSNNCINALRKIELGAICYQTVLEKADEALKENKRFENIYQNHDQVLYYYALQNNLPLENNMPLTDESFFKKFNHHKINIKDQWASHPPREERNERLQQLQVQANHDTDAAWLLFENKDALQKTLTESIYRLVPVSSNYETMTTESFKEKYGEEMDLYTLPVEYNGFYDDRQMSDLNIDQLTDKPFNTENIHSLEILFNNEWTGTTKKIMGFDYDSVMLKAIIDKRIDVKSFDYDGKKSNAIEAEKILEKITTELEKTKDEINLHEETVFCFFYNIALQQNKELAATLKEKYEIHFKNRKFANEFWELGQIIMNDLSPLFSQQSINLEYAETLATKLRNESENLKPFITKFIADNIYTDTDLLKKAENFVAAKYQYYHAPSFINYELETLHLLLIETVQCIGKAAFKSFKDILVFQLGVYHKASSK